MSHPGFLEAVRAAVDGEFEVLGEVGRGERGEVAYLARELATTQLVALRLELSGKESDGSDQYALDVVRELDAATPDVESRCPRCRNTLRRWARFCTQCGLDVSGIGPSTSGKQASRGDLLAAVQHAAAGEYEVLGDMPRAEGGGSVYFAREFATSKIVALRLQQESAEEFSLGVTRVLKTLGGRPADSAPAASPNVTIMTRSRPAAAAGDIAASTRGIGASAQRRRAGNSSGWKVPALWGAVGVILVAVLLFLILQ